MEHFGRKSELNILIDEQKISKTQARFTLVMGRRRIGKTYLIRKSLEGQPHIYLLAMNEAEGTLCRRFQRQIEETLGISIYGNISSMREVFDILFRHATEHHLNLVIDEVQEFFFVRKSIFADMQELWDKYKDQMKINMISCGSIYSLMKELFEDRKQAMYGRLTRRILLRPFPIQTLKEILSHYNPQYGPKDLLCLYTLTGGVPKYVETLIDNKAYTKEAMIRCFCDTTLPFVSEGSDLMNMEFRREATVYYSLLTLIAEGHTTQGELESVLKITTSAYLRNLEENYSMIQRKRPIYASERSQGIRYSISDNFILSWFRFIYPNQGLVAMGRSDQLNKILQQGYDQFVGQMLERYFRQRALEEEEYTEVGAWWDNKGTNEIDMVAIDSINHRIRIAEIKMQKGKISIPLLQDKARKIQPHFKHYQVEYVALSLEDM